MSASSETRQRIWIIGLACAMRRAPWADAVAAVLYTVKILVVILTTIPWLIFIGYGPITFS